MNELSRSPYSSLAPRSSPAFPPELAHDRQFDVRRFFGTLRRHKWRVVFVALLVIVPVMIWTAMQQRLYRGTALVEINPDPVQVFPYPELDRPSVANHFEMFLKGQDSVLRGPSLLARVRDRLAREQRGPVAAESAHLADRLSVQRLENTYTFRIGYVAPAPDAAAFVANLFAEEYIKHHFEAGQLTRERARERLQSELDTLEAKVQQSEKGLVAYAQSHRLPLDEKSESPARVQLAEVAQQHLTAEGDVLGAQSKVSALEKASIDNFPDTLVTTVISGLVNQLLQQEHELTSLQGTFGANWPAVVAKRQEITVTKEQLAREQRASIATALEQARLDLAVASHKRTLLAGTMVERQRLVNDIENASVQYNILRREVETNQKMYEGMLERLKQTSITSGMEFGGIRVVEPAIPSPVVYSPTPWWNLGLASVLGIALGMCFAVGRDYWDTSVSTVDELEHIAALPVLGAVPVCEPVTGAKRVGGSSARLLTPGASDNVEAVRSVTSQRFPPDSHAADAVRNVCASILLSRSDQPPRRIMVTSALPGEGKSTLARELVYAFLDVGAKAILVECDLRRPTLGDRYCVMDGGLTPWLAGLTQDPPVIHETDDGLSMVVAGPRAPNPVALLQSDKLKRFLAELAASQRFVVLDAPPVLGVADARLLASLADGVVIAVRAGRSQAPLVRAARASLASAGANILGTVLNATEPDLVAAYLGEHYYA